MTCTPGGSWNSLGSCGARLSVSASNTRCFLPCISTSVRRAMPSGVMQAVVGPTDVPMAAPPAAPTGASTFHRSQASPATWLSPTRSPVPLRAPRAYSGGSSISTAMLGRLGVRTTMRRALRSMMPTMLPGTLGLVISTRIFPWLWARPRVPPRRRSALRAKSVVGRGTGSAHAAPAPSSEPARKVARKMARPAAVGRGPCRVARHEWGFRMVGSSA